MTNLITYSPKHLETIAGEIKDGTYKLLIPEADAPADLNPINLAAYSIIKVAMFNLTPREISFLGSMTKSNAITPKQRKWLLDLFKLHIGYALDSKPVLKMAA